MACVDLFVVAVAVADPVAVFVFVVVAAAAAAAADSVAAVVLKTLEQNHHSFGHLQMKKRVQTESRGPGGGVKRTGLICEPWDTLKRGKMKSSSAWENRPGTVWE